MNVLCSYRANSVKPSYIVVSRDAYPICARTSWSGSLSSLDAFRFSLTVEDVIRHGRLKIKRILTQDAHDVLPFSQGIQKLLVATLNRLLLGEVYLLRPLGHDIRDGPKPLDAWDGHELQEEAAEPRRAKIRQKRDDFSRPHDVVGCGARKAVSRENGCSHAQDIEWVQTRMTSRTP